MSSTASSNTFVAADGDGYERMMGRWSRRLAAPFLEFAGTASGESVLDVGCGTGNLADAMLVQGRFDRIMGVDASPVYVEHARRRHATDARLSFTVGDACALDLPDASVDRVLSLLMLHFVPDAARAVAEMRRVAKPGSVVAATVWDVRGGYVANRMVFDTASVLDERAVARRAANYTRPMTRPGELGNAWRAAGFEDVAETSLCIRMEFSCFDDYWMPYEGKDGPIAEYVMGLSSSERLRLREAVRRAYLDGESDGARSYAAIAWAVKGTVPTGRRPPAALA